MGGARAVFLSIWQVAVARPARPPRDRAHLRRRAERSTPAILDMLRRHGVSATFFQCGANVERLPSIARAVGSAGHEIGNHSHTHPFLLPLAAISSGIDWSARNGASRNMPAQRPFGSAPPMECGGPDWARRSAAWGSPASCGP